MSAVDTAAASAPELQKYHDDIDRAVDYTHRGLPDVAIEELERLRKQHWDKLDGRLRYRLVANLGYAFQAKGEDAVAGRHFLECRTYQKDDEKARCLECTGYAILDNLTKAFEIAEELRSEFPNSDLAASLWVQTAPEAKPFSEVESSLDTELRKGSETSFALASRALHAGELEPAESYARHTLAQTPDSSAAQERLALILFERSRREASRQLAERPKLSNPASLAESLTLLDKAAKTAAKCSDQAAARFAYHEGLVFRLLQQPEQSLLKLQQAATLDPRNPAFAFQYALELLEQKQNDRAIELLRERVENDESHRVRLLLADLLFVRNRNDDQSVAIGLLEAKSPREVDSETRSDYVSLLATFWGLLGKHLEAKSFLEGLPATDLDQLSLLTIQSSQRRRAGDQEAARRLAIEASNLATDRTPRHDRRRLAIELMRLELYSEAFIHWRALVQPISLSIDTLALLKCARLSGNDRFALDFCGSLRRNSVFEGEALHLEIDILQEYHAFNSAIALMTDCLEALPVGPLRREIRARLSHLGQAIGQNDVVDCNPSHLPTVDEVEPILGLVVTEVFSRGNTPIDGVKYAYELLRRHYESPAAHKAVVVSFLFGRGPGLRIDEPKDVGPGCAVRYRDDSDQSTHWIVVEDGPTPEPARGEFPIDHGLVKALKGRSVGEQFWLRKDNVVQRQGTVLEVWSKYKFRFNRCMEEWEASFPEEVFLWKFTAKEGEDGQPDLSAIFRSVDQRVQETKQQEEIYRNNPLSVTHFAMMSGSTVMDALDHLWRVPDLPIRCCPGRSEEYAHADEAIESTRPLVLDGAALSTCLSTGLFRELGKLKRHFFVSFGTFFDFRRRYLEQKDSPRDGGFLAKHSDQYVFLKNDDEQREKWLQTFREFLESIESQFVIEEGLSLMDVTATDRDELLQALDRNAAETITIAKAKDGVLWTDDLLVALIANEKFQVPRVWTDVLVNSGLSEAIPDDVRNSITCALLKANYYYTRVSPSLALWAAKGATWDTCDHNFAPVVNWLSNPYTIGAGIGQIAALLLVNLWRSDLVTIRTDAVTAEILNRVKARADGLKIIRQMKGPVEAICGIDVLTAEKLERVITRFLATSFLR